MTTPCVCVCVCERWIPRIDADAWLDYLGCPYELRPMLLHGVAKDKDRTKAITPVIVLRLLHHL